MSTNHQKPSSRSFIGMAAMIIGLTLYAFLAAGIGNLIGEWHLAIQMSYYLVAGLAWLYPAKKLLQWMGGQ